METWTLDNCRGDEPSCACNGIMSDIIVLFTSWLVVDVAIFSVIDYIFCAYNTLN